MDSKLLFSIPHFPAYASTSSVSCMVASKIQILASCRQLPLVA